MSLDEYAESWIESGSGGGEPAAGEELLARVRERSEAFERRIRRRDLRESAAAVFVVVVFGYETITAGSWLSRMGAALVMTGALYVMWRLRRARPDEDPAAAGRPVADRLRIRLRQVEEQVRLHETVLWWYLAPLGVGSVMFVVGLGSGLWATLTTLAVIAVLSEYVRRANGRLVRSDLRPRRERLARLLRELEEA